MKKILIFSIILFVILFFCNTLVNATNISMNLDETQGQSTSSTNDDALDSNAEDSTLYGTETENNNNNQGAPSETNIESPVTVGTSAALSSSDLALSNILNIILIVLGILLVLLAIAILIRLH